MTQKWKAIVTRSTTENTSIVRAEQACNLPYHCDTRLHKKETMQ